MKQRLLIIICKSSSLSKAQTCNAAPHGMVRSRGPDRERYGRRDQRENRNLRFRTSDGRRQAAEMLRVWRRDYREHVIQILG